MIKSYNEIKIGVNRFSITVTTERATDKYLQIIRTIATIIKSNKLNPISYGSTLTSSIIITTKGQVFNTHYIDSTEV